MLPFSRWERRVFDFIPISAPTRQNTVVGALDGDGARRGDPKMFDLSSKVFIPPLLTWESILKKYTKKTFLGKFTFDSSPAESWKTKT